MRFKSIADVLFDTSFLLNDSPIIDEIIKILRRDRVSCYLSSTIQTELDDLHYFGRISSQQYDRAIARCKRSRVRNIEDKHNYLQDSIKKECTISMNQEHGVGYKDIRNDCSILTSGLENHIDLILSEDFHFTSKHTDKVVNTICNRTCDRFRRLCQCDILALNKDTFLAAYRGNKIDMDIVESMKLDIRKDSKSMRDGTDIEK